MIISIIIFIITLLILVIIHELGHYLAAKRFGIKVEEFGFGIPPKIFGKKIGETLFSINALPIGGFVRLLGEDEVDKKVLKNPRSFASQNVWKRILVVVSGVVMNLILAWIIFYIVLFSQNFKIIYPAAEPGAFVAKVEENFPAYGAGIKTGEKILSVDGEKISSFDEVKKLIQKKEGGEVELLISDIDGENKRNVKVTPKKTDDGYLIGVMFTPIPVKEYRTFQEKIFSGVTYSYDLTRLTFIGLSNTISDLSAGNFDKASKSVSGPVGIASVTNEILSSGWQAILPYLWFVGVISLTLTIFNVLPIPALDGGRLLFLIIEAISGRKVKAEVERMIHTVGFAILLSLAFLITYSDIRKLIQ